MEPAKEGYSPQHPVQEQARPEVVEAIDQLLADPLKTPWTTYNAYKIGSTIARENNPELHSLLVRKVVKPWYNPEQLAAMSENERGARLIDERDTKQDLMASLLDTADSSQPARQLAHSDLQNIRRELRKGQYPAIPEMAQMNIFLQEELDDRLVPSLNDLLEESIQENGVREGEKLSVLQSFKSLYEQEARNQERRQAGEFPEKIQQISIESVTEKFNLVFANEPIYGELRDALFERSDIAGQDKLNAAVKIIVDHEITKAQSEGREIGEEDLAANAIKLFQVANDGVVDTKNVEYLLKLARETAGDLPYEAAKVLLNETQDLDLGDLSREIALQAASMVFSENSEDYQELADNESRRGKLLIFVESFFKNRRHEIESSLKGVDLSDIDKRFASFTAFKQEKMDEQRQQLVGMLKTEMENNPDEVQVQERDGYPDEIVKMRKGMSTNLLPIEMLDARLRPIIGTFG